MARVRRPARQSLIAPAAGARRRRRARHLQRERSRCFAAIGVATIAGLCALFAMLGLAIRRIARAVRHRGGPITRLGIARSTGPAQATVRLAVSLGLGLTMLIALSGAASSILAEIDTNIPKKAPALFLVDIPREDGHADSKRWPGARISRRRSVRLVPSLRGPVTAVNGTAGARDEGDPRRRVDPARRARTDLCRHRCPPPTRSSRGSGGRPIIAARRSSASTSRPRPRSGLKVGDRMTVTVLGRPIEARIASLRRIDWRSLGFNFAIIFSPGAIDAAPYTLMASIAPGEGRVDGAASNGASPPTCRWSARCASPTWSSKAKTLLESIGGAVRIATAFAILMGMIVLGGVGRRDSGRAAPRHRPVAAGRGDARPGGAQPADRVRLACRSRSQLQRLAPATLAAWALVTQTFEFAFRPDLATIADHPGRIDRARGAGGVRRRATCLERASRRGTARRSSGWPRTDRMMQPFLN